MAERRRRPSHHRPGGGFRNPWPGEDGSRERGAFLRWQVQRLRDGVPTDPDPHELPHAASDVARPRAPLGEIRATWVGHSTFLLQVGGWNVLTDPVWSRRASPVAWLGPERLTPPGLDFDALPPIDAVILSHDHYDHLDRPTIARLRDRFGEALRWITPIGYTDWFDGLGIANVVELDWWHRVSLTHEGGRQNGAVAAAPVQRSSSDRHSGRAERVEGITSELGAKMPARLEIVAAPARHWTRRSPFTDADRLWASFALHADDGAAIYFAGDSGYFDGYREVGARLGPFDLALIPIGAYEPRWFMQAAHMNPEEAVRTYLDLGGRGDFGGMHWGTFRLTDEPPLEPPVRTRSAWRDAGLDEARLWIPRHGETRTVHAGVRADGRSHGRLAVEPDAATDIAGSAGAEPLGSVRGVSATRPAGAAGGATAAPGTEPFATESDDADG